MADEDAAVRRVGAKLRQERNPVDRVYCAVAPQLQFITCPAGTRRAGLFHLTSKAIKHAAESSRWLTQMFALRIKKGIKSSDSPPNEKLSMPRPSPSAQKASTEITIKITRQNVQALRAEIARSRALIESSLALLQASKTNRSG